MMLKKYAKTDTLTTKDTYISYFHTDYHAKLRDDSILDQKSMSMDLKYVFCRKKYTDFENFIQDREAEHLNLKHYKDLLVNAASSNSNTINKQLNSYGLNNIKGSSSTSPNGTITNINAQQSLYAVL